MQPAISQNVTILTKQPTPPIWWILLSIENIQYKAKETEKYTLLKNKQGSIHKDKYLSTQSSVMAMETDRHFPRETQRSKLNISAVDHSLVDYQ